MGNVLDDQTKLTTVPRSLISSPFLSSPLDSRSRFSFDLWDQYCFHNDHMGANFKPHFFFFFFTTSDFYRHFGATSAISLHRGRASTHALCFRLLLRVTLMEVQTNAKRLPTTAVSRVESCVGVARCFFIVRRLMWDVAELMVEAHRVGERGLGQPMVDWVWLALGLRLR